VRERYALHFLSHPPSGAASPHKLHEIRPHPYETGTWASFQPRFLLVQPHRTVTHMPGKLSVLPDCLSRLYAVGGAADHGRHLRPLPVRVIRRVDGSRRASGSGMGEWEAIPPQPDWIPRVPLWLGGGGISTDTISPDTDTRAGVAYPPIPYPPIPTRRRWHLEHGRHLRPLPVRVIRRVDGSRRASGSGMGEWEAIPPQPDWIPRVPLWLGGGGISLATDFITDSLLELP
jgi:hypothetical protein